MIIYYIVTKCKKIYVKYSNGDECLLPFSYLIENMFHFGKICGKHKDKKQEAKYNKINNGE